MDRSFLTHPKIVGCSWEGVVLYPILWVLSDEGVLSEDHLDPVYLSAVSKVPVKTVTVGLQNLRQRKVLLDDLTLSRLFSYAHTRRAPSPTPTDERINKAPVGGVNTPAPASPRACEGFEAYLLDQWGELVSRGKPLAEWIAVQQDAHPDMDLLAESKKARAWEVNQKKPKRAVRRFLSGWFNRASNYKEESVIRAEGGTKHWSGLNAREREKAVREGRTDFSVTVNGRSVVRDLRSGGFVLSGQDIACPDLPYREVLSGIVRCKLSGGGDPYELTDLKVALSKNEARAESDRALSWAVNQIVTDVRYELGLLPV